MEYNSSNRLITELNKLTTQYERTSTTGPWARFFALRAMNFQLGNKQQLRGRDSSSYGYKTHPVYDWSSSPTVRIHDRVESLLKVEYEHLREMKVYLRGIADTTNFLDLKDEIQRVDQVINQATGA